MIRARARDVTKCRKRWWLTAGRSHRRGIGGHAGRYYAVSMQLTLHCEPQLRTTTALNGEYDASIIGLSRASSERQGRYLYFSGWSAQRMPQPQWRISQEVVASAWTGPRRPTRRRQRGLGTGSSRAPANYESKARIELERAGLRAVQLSPMRLVSHSTMRRTCCFRFSATECVLAPRCRQIRRGNGSDDLRRTRAETKNGQREFRKFTSTLGAFYPRRSPVAASGLSNRSTHQHPCEGEESTKSSTTLSLA